MIQASDPPPIDEEAARAWVLDALDRLDDELFVIVLSALGVSLRRAGMSATPTPAAIEFLSAIEVYLGTRGVTLPY